jgi:hypothetical protein
MTDQEYIAAMRQFAEKLRETAALLEAQAKLMGEFVAAQLQRLEEGQGNDG